MRNSYRNTNAVVAAINTLDLDPIKLKLMDPEEGQGWTREYVDKMEIAYKRFLTLMVKFPDETIAPTKDVDKFWHGHILDTLKYAEDCQNVFGYFLHHFPYFGMRGEEDAANLKAAGERMHSIYEREYGESITQSAAFCYAAKPVTEARSAFCYAAKPASNSGIAFCYAAKPAANVASAFCYAAKPASISGIAFCYAAKPAANAASAFCYAAKPASNSGVAFCYAAKPATNAASAFCYAAKPLQHGPIVPLRPVLV
ncbi:MAG: glycine-rich domain-containing protein-like [Betaproteobacteria bacterium]|nr:glycine-rich domain-containing protein-like [Betaproteobacteria bacterium]